MRHSMCDMTLGFVADVGMDGWTVGTPPFMGDYFYPGFPFEGWELQIDTLRKQEFNVGSTAIGANISYSNSGGVISSTWQGVFDSVTITQVTSVDTLGLFFTIKVTLTNMAVAPKNDIYYLRTLDPDNDETWPGGSFTTDNVIQHQMPDTFNVSLVSATGLSTSAPYLGLGTTDTASRAVIYTSWPISSTVDLSTIYAGTYTSGGAWYAEGAHHIADISIGLMTYIPHLATVDSAGDSVLRTTSAGERRPANSASFTMFYSFSQAASDSAIAHTKPNYPLPGTLGIHNLNNTAAINMYPNPAKDQVKITGLNATDNLSLFDMMGRELIHAQPATGAAINTMSLRNVPAGAYVIVITDANGSVRSRMPLRKL